VLGRAGQRGGRCQSELTVDRDGVPLLAHTLLLDGADPALAGPAGTGGARAIGTLAVVGKGVNKPPEDAGEQPDCAGPTPRSRAPAGCCSPSATVPRRHPAPRPLHRVSVTLTSMEWEDHQTRMPVIRYSGR
jgi:hypothetical protein